MESIVRDAIVTHVMKQNLLNDNQHGFVPGRHSPGFRTRPVTVCYFYKRYAGGGEVQHLQTICG